VDVSVGLGIAMAAKDTDEIEVLRKCSVLTNKLLKHGFIPKLEDIINKEVQITHETLSTEIEGMIEDPSKINLKIPQDQVQSCYNPIIQSGGDYDLRASAQSNTNTLKFDVITVSLGSRYQMYCSNIGRTFLIDPPKAVKETYETLVAVQDACLAAMIPGNPLKAVYAAAIKKLEDKGRQDLIEKLPKSLGFSIGLEFREPTMLLTAKNSTNFRSGMIFNLSIGLSDLVLNKTDVESVHDKSAVRVLSDNSCDSF
jgi:nucleosome binding factor SPN SPT16 subunit